MLANCFVQMLRLNRTTRYSLVFFNPWAQVVYHRATNDAQTQFETTVLDGDRVWGEVESHCHPYFAIYNAMAKFKKYETTLTAEQQGIWVQLNEI